MAKWLVDRKILPDSTLNKIYGSYVGDMFRTLRFGAGEAHGRAELMEFNYLLEQGAIRQGADGRYAVDYTAMPGAIASLAQRLLTFEAEGDRAGVEAWYAKYDVMPGSLTKALESTKDIPVEIAPEFELSGGMRQMNKVISTQQPALTPHHHDAAHQLPGTIIVPASDFFATIPAGDSNDGRFPAGEWFFNNNTINMSVAGDVTAKVPVKEAGVYHLFRAQHRYGDQARSASRSTARKMRAPMAMALSPGSAAAISR